MQKATQDKREKDEKTDKMGMAAIEEARMVLPGIQALAGFQLIVAPGACNTKRATAKVQHKVRLGLRNFGGCFS